MSESWATEEHIPTGTYSIYNNRDRVAFDANGQLVKATSGANAKASNQVVTMYLVSTCTIQWEVKLESITPPLSWSIQSQSNRSFAGYRSPVRNGDPVFGQNERITWTIVRTSSSAQKSKYRSVCGFPLFAKFLSFQGFPL